MMRIVEIVYALPFIFFVIVLVMAFGRHFALIFIAIGAVEWLDMARIARGQTLSLKQREYVLSARALGASPAAIIWRHILPNASGPIIAYLTLLVPRVILLESFISFLGLGVQEPLASWGVLIADGARNIQGSIHLLVFPALFLGATLGALQSLGQGLEQKIGAPRREKRRRAAMSRPLDVHQTRPRRCDFEKLASSLRIVPQPFPAGRALADEGKFVVGPLVHGPS